MTLPILAEKALEKVHARLSPSKAHRWLVCPGSMHVTAEDPETEWAAEGTRKHAVLELVLRGKPVLAGDIVMSKPVARETIEQCVEIKDFIQQFRDTHPGWTMETESRVEIGTHVWAGMKLGDCAGTLDAAAYSYDELLVLDAKFGFVKVKAKDNPQLMLYALGLLAEIPFPIRHVTLCIAQPDYDGQVVFDEHRMSREAVEAWAFQQMGVVEEIQAGSYRLQADDHACRYCPARTQCPARLADLEKFRHEEWLQDAPLAELLPLLPRIRAICKDLEQRAMADLNSGKAVPGYKLVASKSKRKWNDDVVPGKVVADIIADAGLTVETTDPFFDRKLKSPAGIEKVIRGIKKMPVKEAKAVVDKYAFVPQGMPKLAPESDPREALAAGGFTLEDVLAASLEEENHHGDE